MSKAKPFVEPTEWQLGNMAAWEEANETIFEAVARLDECLIGAPHGKNAPEGCLCRWCKARRFLVPFAGMLHPPTLEEVVEDTGPVRCGLTPEYVGVCAKPDYQGRYCNLRKGHPLADNETLGHSFVYPTPVGGSAVIEVVPAEPGNHEFVACPAPARDCLFPGWENRCHYGRKECGLPASAPVHAVAGECPGCASAIALGGKCSFHDASAEGVAPTGQQAFPRHAYRPCGRQCGHIGFTACCLCREGLAVHAVEPPAPEKV